MCAALSAESSALLLASKSNYQNLLEGNTLPGVTYPNALSANLTSKRTSHKLAEQGRRNRMNTALQELATMLPATSASPTMGPAAGGPSEAEGRDTKEGGDGRDVRDGKEGSGAGAKANNANKESSSKASTVEMAIDFIKTLQAELGQMRGRLADAEQKLGAGGGSVEVIAGVEGLDDTASSGEKKDKV